MRIPFFNHRTLVAGALFALFFVCFGFPFAGAQGRRIPKRAGHLNDLAEILDPGAKQRLEKVLENLQQKTGLDFVVATVKTSGNEDLYDYSLRVATSWTVGPASREDSVLLVIASESGNFLTHVSSTARAKVSDEIITETGKVFREGIGSGNFTAATVAAVRTFVDRLGASNNFSFATLDPQGGENLIASQQRARTVQNPIAQPSENPQPTPSGTATPAVE